MKIRDKYTFRMNLVRASWLVVALFVLATPVAHADLIYVLKRGADADNNVASIVEMNSIGTVLNEWSLPTVRTDPDHVYLSSVSSRRYMSLSNDGQFLVFNGFARNAADTANERALVTFNLTTYEFESSTRYPTSGTDTLRASASVDGDQFYSVGVSGVGVSYNEKGDTAEGFNVETTTNSYNAIRAIDGKLWYTRDTGNGTQGLYFLDGEGFPTEDTDVRSRVRLTGTGWENSAGSYRDFNFLDNYLFIGGGGSGDRQLQVFLKDTEEEVFEDGWNRLADDSIDLPQIVLGVHAVERDNGEIIVYFSREGGVFSVIFDPTAADGERFGTPVELASGYLEAGEDWGGLVVIPEPGTAVLLFGAFASLLVLVRRRFQG
jgi:hypothetical protein